MCRRTTRFTGDPSRARPGRRVNMSEAMPGVATPLSWSFMDDTTEKMVRGGLFRHGGSFPVVRSRPLPSRTAEPRPIFYGRIALNIDWSRSCADLRQPGTSGDNSLGGVLLRCRPPRRHQQQLTAPLSGDPREDAAARPAGTPAAAALSTPTAGGAGGRDASPATSRTRRRVSAGSSSKPTAGSTPSPGHTRGRRPHRRVPLPESGCVGGGRRASRRS